MKKIILLLLTLTILIYGCVSDPERLVPPEDFKTGKANYLSIPLDTNKLAAEGYELDKGWNIFVWPDNHDNARVEEVLESIEDVYYYIYDYTDKTFYFPSEGKYAKLREHNYYGSRLFDSLKSGHKYGIYLIKEGKLTYSP